MIKFLLLILAITIAVSIIKKLALGKSNTEDKNAKTTKATEAPTPMQKCLYCQVHLPEAQGLKNKKGFFCSQAHALAHQQETYK